MKALTGEVLTGPPMKIPTEMTRMSVSMSEKTDPEAAQNYIAVVCAAYSKRELDISNLRVLLGKMVLAVRENKLYQPRFKLFGEYMEHLEKEHGVSTATIYNAVGMIEQLPDVPTEVLGRLSVKNQRTATQAARRAEPEQVKQIMKYAGLPNPKYREKMEDLGLLPKQGRPEGGQRTSGTTYLNIPDISVRMALRFRTHAKEYGGAAKYLTHLLSLDTKSAAA